MSAFDYLAVLISIVLGLGIANILTGYAALIRDRARIKPCDDRLGLLDFGFVTNL